MRILPLLFLLVTSCKKDVILHVDNSLLKDGWTLTFHDEFEGSSLDSTKWSDPDIFGNYLNTYEAQLYSLKNIEIDAGIATIVARKEPGVGWNWGPNGKQFFETSFTSATLSTIHTFEQTYGLFEIRCKIPSGQGLWPAFWLASVYSWPPEIDIFEFKGSNPEKIHISHSKEDGDRGINRQFRFTDLSRDYHTYSVEWTSGKIAYYLDNNLLFTTNKKIPDKPMFININLAVGGGIDGCGFSGCPDETTPLPAEYKIDYIRVYRKK